jgi:hypothetical protein
MYWNGPGDFAPISTIITLDIETKIKDCTLEKMCFQAKNSLKLFLLFFPIEMFSLKAAYLLTGTRNFTREQSHFLKNLVTKNKKIIEK